ncbi:MAG: hypothetical protein AAGJ35_00020 [Myxococcota bacterium]
MNIMNDVKDRLFELCAKLKPGRLSATEESRIIKSFNDAEGTIFERCRKAILEVFDVDIETINLIEKSASIDRGRNALQNLKQVAQEAEKKSS